MVRRLRVTDVVIKSLDASAAQPGRTRTGWQQRGYGGGGGGSGGSGKTSVCVWCTETIYTTFATRHKHTNTHAHTGGYTQCTDTCEHFPIVYRVYRGIPAALPPPPPIPRSCRVLTKHLGVCLRVHARNLCPEWRTTSRASLSL